MLVLLVLHDAHLPVCIRVRFPALLACDVQRLQQGLLQLGFSTYGLIPQLLVDFGFLHLLEREREKLRITPSQSRFQCASRLFNTVALRRWLLRLGAPGPRFHDDLPTDSCSDGHVHSRLQGVHVPTTSRGFQDNSRLLLCNSFTVLLLK